MRSVLITGATINTGVAIVEKFASEGKNVVFTGRDPEKVAEAEKCYRAKFPNVNIIGYAIDSLIDERTVNERGVEEMFKFLFEKGIFIETLLLNAADQGLGQKIFESPITDIMKVINTNVVWNYSLCEHAAAIMRDAGGGNIVFINSNTAYRAIPDRVAYVASKGGQLGLMRALALDLGKYGIKIIYSYSDKVFESEQFFNISYSPEYNSFEVFDPSALYTAVRNRGTVNEDEIPTLENTDKAR